MIAEERIAQLDAELATERAEKAAMGTETERHNERQPFLSLAFRLITRQAACRLDSGDLHKMSLARLPALLRKNLV